MNKNLAKQNSLVFLTNEETRKNAMMEWVQKNSHMATAQANRDQMNGLWMVTMTIPNKDLRDYANKKWR